MDDGAPSLEVGFAIDTAGSFDELLRLQQVMGSTEARVVADAQKIERATTGMLNLGNATASVTTFGGAATRELANAERAASRAEKAGEALSRQMDRQIATFGMSRAAAAAYVAEQNGLTELAERLRTQEASLAAMRERAAATALREAAAENALAASRAELAAKVQASHAAQEADAIAAEKMRMATDPLYAATKRLNAEIAESTRLYYSGATAPAEYARQQQVLTGRLRAATEQHNLMATAGMRNANSLRMIAVQMPDVVGGLLTGQKPMTIFIQQGFQIAQVGMMAEGGLKGMLSAVVGLAARMTPLIGIAALVAAAFGSIRDSAASDSELKQYAATLGLTHNEMKKLKDVTVTWGDVTKATFSVLAEAAGVSTSQISTGWSNMWTSIGNFGKFSIAVLLGGFAALVKGTYNAFANVAATIGNAFVAIANGALATVEGLLNKIISGVNALAERANSIIGQVPQGMRDALGIGEFGKLAEVALGRVDKHFERTAEDGAAQFKKTFDGVMKGFDRIGARATQNARDRIKDQAAEIIADRTPKKPKKDRADHHGDELAREAAATEAQIRNLYALADAYGVSGAAALIAEARVKAESDAIKKRGDIEAMVDRQIRLAIAQRVSDAAKSTAGQREQADAQNRVNEMVRAGIVPAERAAELVKDQIADLPLLAAIEAAQQRGLTTEANRATAALADQRRERERLHAAERDAQFNSDMSAGRNQLSMLQEELRLVGATDEARVRALATLRATQEAQAKFTDPNQQAAYIAQQAQIADQTQALASAQNNYNDSLSYTANLLGLINENAQTVGQGLSDAFGGIGDGVGRAITALTSYAETQAKIDQEHAAAVKAAGTGPGSYAAIAQAEIVASKKSQIAKQQATMQAISGIKSLFREHSGAYKAMTAIEKAYAIFQAVQTAAAIARDISHTASALVNSGTRTTANTAEGGSKIFSQLGVWAFPVVAAMVAVLAALGAKGRGGGSGAIPPMSADDLQAAAGTGTVLGAPKDKSESIARSLEMVAKNTNSDLQYSNQMLLTLRSIDNSIGAMATTVAKQINVAGSLFDTSGLGLGSSGSSGFLGLFSSSTTRTLYDSGIQLAATTVGNIIANGIAGNTYQIVEQVKKKSGFLGIGGGTKTSYVTTSGGLPGDITSAVQDVIVALRNGLVTAANSIGIQGAEAIINGFTVSIGKVSFKDMSGQEIEDQLQAIFSSVGDQMAKAIYPELAKMQQIGEGLFETFVRVAKEYETIDVELRSIGKAFGAVGVNSIAARDALIQLFGGLDEFITATDTFKDRFLTEAEKIAPVQEAVFAELARLGIRGVTTREQFKNVVLGLDLTTDAGRQLYASLLAVAPAFDKVLSYYEDSTKTTADGLQSTADKFNGFADTLKKYRDTLFDTAGASAASTAQLAQRFSATATLAATGDATALGNLQTDAKAYLDAAKLTARTPLEYQRALSEVAAGVDRGIFAATETADYAQLQLDVLKNATSILSQIAESTAATVEALKQPVGTPIVNTPAPVVDGPDAPATQSDITQLREDTNAGLQAVATNTLLMLRLWKGIERDGALNTRVDEP